MKQNTMYRKTISKTFSTRTCCWSSFQVDSCDKFIVHKNKVRLYANSIIVIPIKTIGIHNYISSHHHNQIRCCNIYILDRLHCKLSLWLWRIFAAVNKKTTVVKLLFGFKLDQIKLHLNLETICYYYLIKLTIKVYNNRLRYMYYYHILRIFSFVTITNLISINHRSGCMKIIRTRHDSNFRHILQYLKKVFLSASPLLSYKLLPSFVQVISVTLVATNKHHNYHQNRNILQSRSSHQPYQLYYSLLPIYPFRRVPSCIYVILLHRQRYIDDRSCEFCQPIGK